MSHPWVELWLIRVIGSLPGSWEQLDRTVDLLLRNDLPKGVPFAAALLVLWTVPHPPQRETERASALHITLAAMGSLMVGRIVQHAVDSPRPLMVPDIAAMYPVAFEGYQFDWNSFPSDHMALYFAIALGALWLRRPLAMELHIWSLAGVAFPRLYVGYHYPIDIIGGMAVAAAWGMLWWTRRWVAVLLRKADHLATRHPSFCHGKHILSVLADRYRVPQRPRPWDVWVRRITLSAHGSMAMNGDKRSILAHLTSAVPSPGSRGPAADAPPLHRRSYAGRPMPIPSS